MFGRARATRLETAKTLRSMLSVADVDRPKIRRILEIAIILSIALHLLFGGVVAIKQKLTRDITQRLTPHGANDHSKDDSTVITIESQPKKIVAKPNPPPVQALSRKPAAPPRVAVVAPPDVRPKPTEIARVVPHATAYAAAHPVPNGNRITNEAPSAGERTEQKPAQVARITGTKPGTAGKLSDQDLAAMNAKFAQTIAMARANNDPTRVTAQAPVATMKRAHFGINGIDDLMRQGEGYLTPQTRSESIVNGQRGYCYYVNFQVTFSGGEYDTGPVYWPICYPYRADPFLNNFQHFPLPGPPPGWQPTPNQMSVIATHRVLRAYFPDKFPNEDQNGN